MKHNYIKQNNPVKLTKEIKESVLAPVFSYLEIENNVIDIYTADLDMDQQIILDQIISNHDGQALVVNYLRIYSIMLASKADKSVPPFGTDYVTGLTTKLHRKQVMVKGEVQQEFFYKNFNGITYSDLVVKETHVYGRDALGFAKSRTTTVSWFYEDDTECAQNKNWVKYYDNLQMIEEGITRRGNMIKSLQPKVLGLLQMTMPPEEQVNIVPYGRALLSELKNDFENFTNHSDKAVYATLQTPELVTKFPWLNNQIPNAGGLTILNYIVSEVTI